MSGNYDFTLDGQSVAESVLQVGERVRFKVARIHGAGVHGATVRTSDRPGGDGSRMIDANLPERVVLVEFSINAGRSISLDSMVILEKAERALSGVMSRRGLSELRFPHQDGYFMAKPGRVTVEERYDHVLKGTLEFVCPSPFLYGDEVTTNGSLGVLNIGTNYFVEPVILWTTGETSGAPHLEVDGERLTIDTQVSEGQQIRIDSSRKETRVGGVLNVENIHGVYPRLSQFSEITTSAGGDVQVTYQARWI